MKIVKSYLAILLLAFTCGCEDWAMEPGFQSPFNTNPKNSDNFIILTFGGGVITDKSNWYLTSDEGRYIKNFNKRNYPEVYSIVFAPLMRSLTEGNYGYAELYNVTDSIPISRSQVKSNLNEWVELKSENIFDEIPEKKITLAIRLRSEKDDMSVVVSASSCLYLIKE